MSRLNLDSRLWRGAACMVLLVGTVVAHEHHDDRIPEGEAISVDPVDVKLWIHMLLQTFTWGIIFPTGMTLGIIKSRWHVPVQVLGTALAIVGYFLGHSHGGRQFKHNAHASYAPILGLLLATQVFLGIYLRLHIERGFLGTIRKGLVSLHGLIGKTLPVASWVQMLFGGITALGFCQGDHLGQCAAHFIMGSAFIGYGIILTILLLVGQFWLRRTGRSQEFFDSTVIACWGCVNTFTEHRWGGPWVRNDLQHTTMGIIWWCAGLVGIWLSRTRDGRPKRNIIPAMVILLTGYGMSAHPQELMLSTMVHSAFGWTLMAAGAARIVEISFVLRDKPCVDPTGAEVHSFQHLTPFLLYTAGFLFMGATEEQMQLISGANVTHVSYIFILYSISFLLYLFVNILLHIYAVSAFPTPSTPSHLEAGHIDASSPHDFDEPDFETYKSRANGYRQPKGNLHLDGTTDEERRRAKNAEEFELDALISDEEEDESSSTDVKVKGRSSSRGGGAVSGSEESGRERGQVRL